MKNSGKLINHELVGDAPVIRDPVVVVVAGVEGEVDRQGEETGESVRNGHGDQKYVGGVTQGFLAENCAHQTVGDEDEEDEDGREVTVDHTYERIAIEFVRLEGSLVGKRGGLWLLLLLHCCCCCSVF